MERKPADRTPGTESRTELNGTIELLRVGAALGVIWFHMEAVPWRRVGFAGLVFFLVIATIFQTRGAQREDLRRYFRKRASRLMIPWAAWFAIYAVLNAVTGKAVFPNSYGVVPALLAGPWIGLWYLPFALLSAGVIYGSVQLLNRLPFPVQFGLSCGISLVTFGLAVWIRSLGPVVVPWAQWLQAAPSIPLGLTLALAQKSFPGSVRKLAVLCAGILGMCALSFPGDPGMALSYGVGTTFVIAGFVLQRNTGPLIRDLGSMCLGVYLIHGAVMAAFKMVPGMAQHYFLWFALTSLASFAAIALMQRIPFLARIV